MKKSKGKSTSLDELVRGLHGVTPVKEELARQAKEHGPPVKSHWRFKKEWVLPPTPPSLLRDLLVNIEMRFKLHPAWTVAESLLRPSFDAILIYAANEEAAQDQRKLRARMAELEGVIWRNKNKRKEVWDKQQKKWKKRKKK